MSSVMGGFQIYISEVIKRYEASGMTSHSETFSINYTYLDKDDKVVERFYERCRRRTAKTYDKARKNYKDIKSIERTEKNAMKFHLEVWQYDRWEVRNPFIAQVTHFNNLLIDHEH